MRPVNPLLYDTQYKIYLSVKYLVFISHDGQKPFDINTMIKPILCLVSSCRSVKIKMDDLRSPRLYPFEIFRLGATDLQQDFCHV